MEEVFQFINFSLEGKIDNLKALYNNSSDQEYLIRNGFKIAFSYACYNGFTNIIQWMYSIRNDMVRISETGFEFSWACQAGKLEIIRQIKIWYPDLDVSANNEEALFWACWSGHLHIVKQLIEWNPNVNIYAQEKRALQYACNHIEILEYLQEVKGPIDFSGIDIQLVSNPAVRQMILNQKSLSNFINNPILNGENIECPICKICPEEYVVTSCGHNYCLDCIQQWLNINNNCPYCRAVLL